MNRFFYMDELNKTLLAVGVVAFLARLLCVKIGWLYSALTVLAVAALIFFVIRLIFSNNRTARERENRFFAVAFSKVKSVFTGRNSSGQKRAKVVTAKPTKKGSLKERWRAYRNYRYLVCPQCHQKLRVPRGKGKIKVTCTTCKNQFIAKS